jgi:hypothetical protein
MAKNKKHKNAINKQRKYDMDLLAVEGFDDVPSALAALDSVRDELRTVEKDYDALIQKTLELEEQLAAAHRVIVAQAMQIHTVTENAYRVITMQASESTKYAQDLG